MFDCNDDIINFQDEKVTLPSKQRTQMREHRDTNRQRLKSGLAVDESPAPVGCHTQGSYAMRTMIQHVDNDYDIDDGVYFKKSDLVGPKGGDKSAADAKEMVRTALEDKRFKKPIECRKNCVRVYYNEGYHVDIPVYRRTLNDDETFSYELAGSDWRDSDPRAVTKWFNKENNDLSPNTDNGGQLRRVVKLLKYFAHSRASWSSQITSGFVISKLVTECFKPEEGREDCSLRLTMQSISDRLHGNLRVYHPVIDGEELTNGAEDSKTKFLREKLDWALGELSDLDDDNCDQAKARKAWDRVFSTTYFTDKGASKKYDSGVTSAAIIKSETAKNIAEQAVDRRGGGRYG